MRKVVHAVYVSLDGVVADPAWTGPFWNDELEVLQRQQLFASDALLLGRVTYEQFAASWPEMTDESDFAERMNALPKHVASRTLPATGTTWNATVLGDDVIAEVKALKDQDGGDLLIYGSATFADLLGEASLIDEYRLMVFPVIVGTGPRLFSHRSAATLQLRNVVTTSTGVTMLTYALPA